MHLIYIDESGNTGNNLLPMTAMQTIAALADPLIHRGNEAMPDILAWLQGQYQSGAARGSATGTKKGSNRTNH